MPARIGIELAPSVCRIVELDAPLVRSFSVIPWSDHAVLGRQTRSGRLSLISVCGPLPDLRSMAALLVERLNIEVEPLDTLFGIDSSRVTTGTDHLSDRIAELRLAWAAVLGWSRSRRTPPCSGTARAGCGA